MENLMQLNSIQIAELKPIVSDLIENYAPVHLFCFGTLLMSRTAGGLFPVDRHYQQHRYFLLMIVNDNCLKRDAQAHLNKTYESDFKPTISIITHREIELDYAFKDNTRFYVEVILKGFLLFSANEEKLNSLKDIVREESLEMKIIKAEMYERYYTETGLGFLEVTSAGVLEEREQNIMFLLNQAVKYYCYGLLMVHLDYQPYFDDLNELINLCTCIDGHLTIFFPRYTDENKRRFDVLNNSFALTGIYEKDDIHQICLGDIDAIKGEVDNFMEVVGNIADAKIIALKELREQQNANQAEDNDTTTATADEVSSAHE